jgi:hypothetical protein
VLAIALLALAEPGGYLLAAKMRFGTVLYHFIFGLVQFCTRKKVSWYTFVPLFFQQKCFVFVLEIHFSCIDLPGKRISFFSGFLFLLSGNQKKDASMWRHLAVFRGLHMEAFGVF